MNSSDPSMGFAAAFIVVFLLVAFAAVMLFVIWVVMRRARAPPPSPPRPSGARPTRGPRPTAQGGPATRPRRVRSAAPRWPTTRRSACVRSAFCNAPLFPRPTPTGSPGGGPFVAPDPAELAPHFRSWKFSP